MTRLMKWSVGVAIILGLIYLALVAITGTKMREIAEQQLAAINEQEPEIEARIEWQETGFWSSSGVVNVDVDEAGLQFTHTINLRHGALRAGVSGEVTAIIDGFNINNQLFSEQPITIDGHVGLGGLSLTYHIPGIQYQDSGLGLEYQTAPFDLDVVLRDKDVIMVPEYNGTVRVMGAVLYPNSVTYKDGKSLRYYVKSAGGFDNRARKGRAFVIYMNGMVDSGLSAKIRPGCIVIIPSKMAKEPVNWSQVVQMLSSTASMGAVVISAINLAK